MPQFRIRSTTIAYDDIGQGFPVVLVHGSANSHQQWRTLAGSLAPRYRVLAPDLYGCGETSAWSEARAITHLDEAEIILALAREIGEPFHLVGDSYGACASLYTAPLLEGKLLSLTLIEPTTFQFLLEDECDGDTWDEVSLLARRHIAMTQAGMLRACAEAFMTYWLGAGAWNAMPSERQEAMVALMPKVAAEWQMLFTAPARIADFTRINAPLLLLYGAQTTRAVRSVCQRLAAAMPQAELIAIKDADHFLSITHPAAVHAALTMHFARSEPAMSPRRASA